MKKREQLEFFHAWDFEGHEEIVYIKSQADKVMDAYEDRINFLENAEHFLLRKVSEYRKENAKLKEALKQANLRDVQRLIEIKALEERLKVEPKIWYEAKTTIEPKTH